MHLITLRRRDTGKEIHLNFDHVHFVSAREDGGANLHFGHDRPHIEVIEEPEWIVNSLKGIKT